MSGLDRKPPPMAGAMATLNGRGYMLEALDGFASEFAQRAGSDRGEALDIGCAYGVATRAALAAGARVCACDMEPRHLALLEERTPAEDRPRLRTVPGTLPDVEFAAGSFGNILASRVIHFLAGADVTRVIGAMRDWLRPGGRLFLVVDTPYMPNWSRIVPAYEAARAAGDPWPGFIPDFSLHMPAGSDRSSHPAFLNTLDPDILVRECNRAGLQVERAGFFPMQRLGPNAEGREHAGCVARKPD